MLEDPTDRAAQHIDQSLSVASLHSYPLKGGAAIDRVAVDLEERGFAGDRRWMLVRPDGRFITQREMPKLATLRAQSAGEGLVLEAPGLQRHTASFTSERRDVVVWNSLVNAATVDPQTDAALSDWCGVPVHLVHMDEAAVRVTNAEWAASQVSFADGYPILITTTGSLDNLNERLRARGESPVIMRRFRPNLVIEAPTAWVEDTWARLAIGDVVLDVCKPCTRCTVTTVDQATGTPKGEEPLRTLVSFRRSLDRRVPGVLFGWNAVVVQAGAVRVGDTVRVLHHRPTPWPTG